jgi:tRNA threonylcarbamoyladenosine biosynthesis protein TsaB
MLILGIDTATAWGTLALQENEEILMEVTLKSLKGGGEFLLSFLNQIIKKTGRALSDIDLIAVGTGPGSYTGIRVGLAAVKGLAVGLERPVYAVNTLRIIAENARFSPAKWMATVIDARRNEVYGAVYQLQNYSLIEVEPPQVFAVEKLAVALSKYPEALINGDGSKIHHDFWKHFPNIHIGPRNWDHPYASNLTKIAWEERDLAKQITSGECACALVPCYLRKVEAELRLEEGLNAN